MLLIKRKNILEFCKPFIEGEQRLVLFRAGAGYGKSVAAQQVAEAAQLPVVHVMCTTVDHDPTKLAHKLLKALQAVQPGLDVARTLRPLLSSGTPEEAVLAARDSFKAAFGELKAERLTILIDDTHLLRESPALHLLRLLVDLSPSQYGFLITSRQSLTAGTNPVFSMWDGLVVNQTQLEFDKVEIFELYQKYFGINLTSDQADLLLETTEGGWPVGVILLKGEVSKLKKGYQLRASDEAYQYFIRECLNGLSAPIIEELSLLAQLDEIPLNMLKDLGMHEAMDTLHNLCNSGLFIDTHQNNSSIFFRFHHLFQETLQKLIVANLAAQCLQQFNTQACKWLEDNGSLEESLLLLTSSKNWKEVSSFIRRNGPKLLVHNKLSIVQASLADCPEETLLADEWLSAMYGFSILFSSTTEALRLLEHAFQLARDKNQDTAELIAGLGLLNYLLLFNADLWRMRDVSQRVAHLTEKSLQNDSQTFELATPCAFLLPPTIAYSSSNYELSIRCTDLLKKHYQNKIDRETPIEFFFANLYAYKFIGNTRKVIDLMQSQIFKVNDISINPAARFFIIGFFANLHQMLNIKDYYNYLYNETIKRFPEICENSFMVGFFRVFEMDILLSDGKYDQVIDLANDSLQMDIIVNSPHIASLCWQYYAMAQVLLENHDEAKRGIQKALSLRAKAGGLIFILLAHNVYAAILSLTGETKAALRVFDSILKRSESLRDGYQRPMTHAYRANLYLEEGREKEALADINAMLKCMEEHQNFHFYFWDAKIMQKIMKFYLSKEAPSQFSRTLLRKRFNFNILSDDSPIPRLPVSLAEQKVISPTQPESSLRITELPKVEAKLLELLLTRRERPVGIQECIEHLWDTPDKMKDPRNNLYVHLNKLRGRLAELVGKHDAKQYLSNKAGFISLKHIDVDQHRLEDQARVALRLIKQERWWDAEMRFRRVHRLLDEFPQEYDWPLSSKQLFTGTALAWVDLAERCQAPHTVIKAAEMGLRFDPVHDRFHGLRYRMYLQLGMPAKAESAKRDYARAIGAKGRALHELGKSML